MASQEPLIKLAKNITTKILTQNGANSSRSANMIANGVNNALFQR